MKSSKSKIFLLVGAGVFGDQDMNEKSHNFGAVNISFFKVNDGLDNEQFYQQQLSVLAKLIDDALKQNKDTKIEIIVYAHGDKGIIDFISDPEQDLSLDKHWYEIVSDIIKKWREISTMEGKDSFHPDILISFTACEIGYGVLQNKTVKDRKTGAIITRSEQEIDLIQKQTDSHLKGIENLTIILNGGNNDNYPPIIDHIQADYVEGIGKDFFKRCLSKMFLPFTFKMRLPQGSWYKYHPLKLEKPEDLTLENYADHLARHIINFRDLYKQNFHLSQEEQVAVDKIAMKYLKRLEKDEQGKFKPEFLDIVSDLINQDFVVKASKGKAEYLELYYSRREYLKQNGVDFHVDFQMDDNTTALILACQGGHLEAVKFLLSTNEVDLGVQTTRDYSSIICAYDEKNPEVIKCLIDYLLKDENCFSGDRPLFITILDNTHGVKKRVGKFLDSVSEARPSLSEENKQNILDKIKDEDIRDMVRDFFQHLPNKRPKTDPRDNFGQSFNGSQLVTRK